MREYLLWDRFGQARLRNGHLRVGSRTRDVQRLLSRLFMCPATNAAQSKTRLTDYSPPGWLVERVKLIFDLAPSATRVRATIQFRRNGGEHLVLSGRALKLLGSWVDGADVMERVVTTRDELRLSGPLPDAFEWTCETEVDPQGNTELEGLYLSKQVFCTQCEAEGFRKMTYYPDRPDVMTVFDVRIEADQASQPVLLSNGNLVAQGPLPGGRHFAEWHDPHPKPSYLFALVAGDLVSFDDRFTTCSGRTVDLKIWVRAGDETKCAYAMDALKRAMRWDEATYGREYDLDLFQIVAVDDFNMGAMENKSLNIFNSKFVLASAETATDQDYERIEGIVAHEYFHNWTGNRITCRDWFQLCLKEGLTVFRDQEFSSDMRSAAVQRIREVQLLRARQFSEDAGPLAHPVRPTEYVEINNFYTATVYEKGAEVIRMLKLLVGPDAYRNATDLYFERHDGQACTIEDWLTVFEDTTGRDLTQFARWYHQAGTPKVTVREDWEPEAGDYTLTLLQDVPDTPGQTGKGPHLIPLAMGLLGPAGEELRGTEVLELCDTEQVFRFASLAGKPTLSINRGFSAPVVIDREIDDDRRGFLLAHDPDPFSRAEAGRTFGIHVAISVMAGSKPAQEWVEALSQVLSDSGLDAAYKALILDAPSERELASEVAAQGDPIDPTAIHDAVKAMRAALGGALAEPFRKAHAAMQVPGPYTPDAVSAGKRALANRAMTLLAAASPEGLHMATRQFDEADNMTLSASALRVLVEHRAPAAGHALARFYQRWRNDPLVIDKWFALQAVAPGPDTVQEIETLTQHESFDWKNPNRFRALIGVFAMQNPTGFHAADGSGYRLVTDWLIKLDAINPQTTAALAGAFESWRRYGEHRQALMRAEMTRMIELPNLSKNTREIVERLLAD